MKLSDLIDFNPKRPLEKGAITPFIEMADLPEGERDVSGIGNRVFNGGGSKFKNGDTLFARITPCLENGKTAKVSGLPDNAVGHGSTEFIVMAAKDPGIDEDFVYYVARHPEFRAYAKGRMEGTSGRQRVSWQAISDYEIPDFSSLERSGIGSVLSSMDNLISSNRRGNQALEAMARTLFKAWFVDFEPVRAKMDGRWMRGESLPGLPAHLYDLVPDRFDDDEKPEGWEYKPLSNFIEIFDSRRVPLSSRERAERQGPYPYHGATGVMDSVDDFLFDGIYVLLGEDGSVTRPNGRPYTQYVWGKFWVNNHAHVLRGQGISSETLLLFLEQCDVAPFVTGAVQPKLSQGNLKSIPFLDPGEEILRRFGEIAEPIYGQIRDAQEQSRTLVQLRDTLLPKLISGELRVPDAERIVGAAV